MKGVAFAYNLMFFCGVLLCSPALAFWPVVSKKRRKTFFHRLGVMPLPRDATAVFSHRRPVWIHALSVGEVLAAEPLVQALRRRFAGVRLVLSVSTPEGHQIADARFRGLVEGIFYFPFDLLFSVKRVVAQVDPKMVVIIETDVWPNFLWELNARNIPCILANARISPGSYSRYRRFADFVHPVFSALTRVCVQSVQDVERFRKLGVCPERITVAGNLKFDRQPVPGGRGAGPLKTAASMLAGKRVLLAGSTHEGEEPMLMKVCLRLKNRFPDLFLIVVPRNPARALAVRRDLGALGAAAVLLSELGGSSPSAPMDALVIDAMGMLNDLYAVCRVAFVGGSLVPCGGHNPLEAAALSKPILFGPDMSDFSDIARLLLDANAAIQVRNAEELHDALLGLYSEPDQADAMGTRAYGVLGSNRGSVGKTLDSMAPFLEPEELP